MDFKKKAEKIKENLMWSYGNGVSYEENNVLLEKALKEIWNEALNKSAEIASEGPWISPCFEDKKIAKYWGQCEQKFGEQIAVLIRQLKEK